MNGDRRKVAEFLSDPRVTVIVVEDRDRLTRFGFEDLAACWVRVAGRLWCWRRSRSPPAGGRYDDRDGGAGVPVRPGPDPGPGTGSAASCGGGPGGVQLGAGRGCKAVLDQRAAERTYGLVGDELTPTSGLDSAGAAARRGTRPSPRWRRGGRSARRRRSTPAWTPWPARLKNWSRLPHRVSVGVARWVSPGSSPAAARHPACGSPPGPSASSPTASMSMLPRLGRLKTARVGP